MLVYISHSSSDFKLFKSLRDQCEARGFTIVTREKPFEFGETLTEKAKLRIELSNVAIIMLTSSGRTSFRVFQEANFIAGIGKDHFVIEGFGKKVEVRKKLAECNPSLESDENYFASLAALEKILQKFSVQLKPEAFTFVYHTDLVY